MTAGEKNEKKILEPLTKDDQEASQVYGRIIYEYLQGSLTNENCINHDVFLNSICVALIHLMHTHVEADNREQYIHVVYKILRANL